MRAVKYYVFWLFILFCSQTNKCHTKEILIPPEATFGQQELKLSVCSTVEGVADATNVLFYLYTKFNPDTPEQLFLNDKNGVEKSHFNKNDEVVVFSHGFTDSAHGDGPKLVRDAYMEKMKVDPMIPMDPLSKNFSVILVDWCQLASVIAVAENNQRERGSQQRGFFSCPAPPSDGTCSGTFKNVTEYEAEISRIPYVTPACNTIVVGDYVAKFLHFLTAEKFTTPSKIHFIGHSLGAHVAGRAGHSFNKEFNYGKIDRITGLDPALPLFHGASDEEKLDPSDADFVDVIHTAGRETWCGLSYSLGFLEPLGHVDFYPNDGKPGQPGCGDFWDNLLPKCSHSRAWAYYAESVNDPHAFLSCKCDDWKQCSKSLMTCSEMIPMGYDAHKIVDKEKQVWLHLGTNSESPYSLGVTGSTSPKPSTTSQSTSSPITSNPITNSPITSSSIQTTNSPSPNTGRKQGTNQMLILNVVTLWLYLQTEQRDLLFV